MESSADKSLNNKIIITILCNPLLFSNLDLEYHIKNINNGIYGLDGYHIDLEFLFWYANKPLDDLLVNSVFDLEEKYTENTDKLKEFINKDFTISLNDVISNNLNSLDKLHANNIKGNISSIKYNYSFQNHNFKGYGAVHQFNLLTEHINDNTDYDYYFFISSNFVLVERTYIKQYLDKFIKSNVPFIIPNSVININKSDEKKIRLEHGNMNTFCCNPSKLKDFFENKINFMYDVGGLKSIGEMLSIATTFSIHNGKYFKLKWKESISTDFDISKEDFNNDLIFPTVSEHCEPAVHFPFFMLMFSKRFPEIYGTKIIKIDSIDLYVPEYSIESIIESDYNKTEMTKYRIECLWEPFGTNTLICDIFSKKYPLRNFKINEYLLEERKKCLKSLILYLDNLKFQRYNNGISKSNDFFVKDFKYYKKYMDLNIRNTYKSIIDSYN